ncbi:Thioredoxin reductase [Methylophaga frappieri]|uniref:Thioredoxin reductase n=1 Tax=Methylophaga frappieri (strain ATCC BAA-2434 / DSM 25690 / JAM7) TaxID=754477 RepID=I1YG90_METFJ|nr:NAD(P)/FAD-dependent oxidoreductase [Methylophaga frappieri]AFJ01933.1 Thioredoxin reductase [Methylophaga frappieri]
MNSSYDVIIVGAGAAGVGMATKLQMIPELSFVVLEAGEIGESFRRWPKQTRFITPSFHSNPFGLADLNAITEYSSPAIFCQSQHPTGKQYADYLTFMAQGFELPIIEDCQVTTVKRLNGQGFSLETSQGQIQSRYLIWATGEFQFPDVNPFMGAEYCIHYATVSDWADYEAEEFIVIGGYESGVDASVNLIKQGHVVRLLVKKDSWEAENMYDPSLSLSPHTRDRLNEALASGKLLLEFGVHVDQVLQHTDQTFHVHAEDGRSWSINHAPILATGFLSGGGAQQIASLWAWDNDGHLLLTEADESTITPGLFLIGPQVRQEDRLYCFIYKFRQRFTQMAKLIALCLNYDDSQLHSESDPWGPYGNSDCCEGCEC